MKKYFPVAIFVFNLFVIISCSSSIETANLTAEERLAIALKFYEDEDYLEAIKEFEAILIQFPASGINDDATYYLGMSRFKRGEYLLGAYEFSKLIKSMPTSEYLSKSQFMLAECYYQLSPDFSLEQRNTVKAIQEFQAFIDFFPLDEKVAEAEAKIAELNQKLAKKEFETARIYEKLEYTNAALFYYDNVMQIYHDTEYAPLAHFNKINLLISKKKFDDALESAKDFVKNYPNNSKVSEVQKIIVDLEKQLSVN
ncbi:MAG: outer membrane protein assembly factor BamD [Ignavibacterium sp.]|nr:outer membrane protein assembly factor BamD [Ignavibacterium sp.]MCX7610690.1 outer membrane protein assembly factor BamD [Ignavibacterium sp.]MDW8375506.1 outer membrane protein assembly factor BamD [Ignavibacteriales bacterium]